MVTFYSFCWSVIISSIFVLLFYFLRKKTVFLLTFGFETLLLLFVFCIIRMIIPFEFKYQKVLNDPYIYAFIMKPYTYLLKHEVHVSYYIFIIWVLGSCFCFYRFFQKVNTAYSYLKTIHKHDSNIANNLLSIIDPSKKLSVFQSSDVEVPFVAGTFHPIIYIPEYTYTEKQLYYILLHEYTHYKNKDLWVKLLCNLFCITFWWNPIIYLLPKDLDSILELKCDTILSKNLTESEKIEYLETIVYTLHNIKKIDKKDVFLTTAFVQPKKDNFIKQRFAYLLNCSSKHKNTYFYFPKFCSLLLLCTAFFLSYYFLLQPIYDTPDNELWESGTSMVIDSSNSYLIQKDSETYYLYCNGNIIAEVSADEVQSGVCDYLPIKESGDD